MKWKHWAVPVTGLVPGLPLGTYVFYELNESQLRISIGITLLVAVALIAAVP